MKINFELDGRACEADLTGGISLAILMDFDGPQPNHFGAPKASRAALEAGGFVGDTRRGGSCNVDVLRLVPHCNGTHTETVGHIVDEEVFAGHPAGEAFSTATLITVQPSLWRKGKSGEESYRPPLSDDDPVILRTQLEDAWRKLDNPQTTSLIVRTTSDFRKKSVAYGEQNYPAFFTVQAMQWIVSREFRHLLVDLPSVDRMYDEGRLTNHHLYWQVPEGTHQLQADSRQDKTITEMILVPDEVSDGVYLLNLQLPALGSDAVPSRPVIYPVRRI
jgi:kynurenine formamidase